MDMFKKKSLYAALAGIGALGLTDASQAVNLNPDGLGQVLIYPYYTTRADANGNVYNSLLSVVNTTNTVKAAKVRFLEGKNSREVLDFNLFLSPKDVWTAAIGPSTRTAGAMVITSDKSCTLPFGGAAGQNLQSGGADFVNFAYSSDAAGGGLDRTTEGYVEIIEMATFDPASVTATNVTHVNGVPKNCAAQTDAQASTDALPPGGGLTGGMTLVNVNAGSDYTEDAVALDRFSVFSLYTNAGSTLPDLTQANPPVSIVVANNTVFQSTWPAGPDPVSALLMHDHIYNEFVLDASTKSGTDWVVTMPTKRFYYSASGAVLRLFQRNFTSTGACDDVSLNIFDREENTTSTPLNFSPPPPTQAASVCWEANVVTFNKSNVLGSANSANISTTFQNGWLDLGFLPASVTAPTHTLPNAATTRAVLGGAPGAPGAATYFGLPVVGFAVQSFTNGAIMVNGVSTLSNYGGNFVQKGTRAIQ
jgi:hypothetical protein